MTIIRWLFSRERFHPTRFTFGHFPYAVANPNPGVFDFVLERTSHQLELTHAEAAFRTDSLAGFQSFLARYDTNLNMIRNWLQTGFQFGSATILEYLFTRTSMTYKDFTLPQLWPARGYFLERTSTDEAGAYPPSEPKRERFLKLMKMGYPYSQESTLTAAFYEWVDVNVLRTLTERGWVPGPQELDFLASPTQKRSDYNQRLKFVIELGSPYYLLISSALQPG